MQGIRERCRKCYLFHAYHLYGSSECKRVVAITAAIIDYNCIFKMMVEVYCTVLIHNI